MQSDSLASPPLSCQKKRRGGSRAACKHSEVPDCHFGTHRNCIACSRAIWQASAVSTCFPTSVVTHDQCAGQIRSLSSPSGLWWSVLQPLINSPRSEERSWSLDSLHSEFCSYTSTFSLQRRGRSALFQPYSFVQLDRGFRFQSRRERHRHDRVSQLRLFWDPKRDMAIVYLS